MTYEPCQRDIRLFSARGPFLFQCAGIQTIRPAGSPYPWARVAPCATSFIWGNWAKRFNFVYYSVHIVLLTLLMHLFLWPWTLRFQSSKSGKIYLHRDIRLLFSRKSMEVDSGAAYELQSFTESPIDPPFSSRCWDLNMLNLIQYASLTHIQQSWQGSKGEI